MTPAAQTMGVLRTLDLAVELAKAQGMRCLLRASAPSLLLTWLVLMIYYAEMVEGLSTLRPLFAFCLVSLWCARGLSLGELAGRCADRYLSPFGIRQPKAPATRLLAATLWIGAYVWAWSWLVLMALQVHVVMVALVLPVLSLRTALAPSWLACAQAEDVAQGAGGLSALRTAVRSARGQRLAAVFTELVLLAGAAGLAFNLGAVTALTVNLAQDTLGLELFFVRSFLSPENHFALLLIGGLSLTALDPVRAAYAAVLHTEFRLNHEGVRVRALVERATSSVARTALLASLCWLHVASPASAEEWPSQPEPAQSSLDCDQPCVQARASDQELALRIEAILAEPAFLERSSRDGSTQDASGDAFSEWLERLLRNLSDQETPALAAPSEVRLPVSGALWPLLTAAAALLLAAWLWRKTRPHLSVAQKREPAKSPGSPEQRLADALALSRSDLPRAVASLYQATLSGLSQRRLLVLSRERTNGQYVRALGLGDERTRFAELTRYCDAVCYGGHAPDLTEFAHCQKLAESLIRGAAGEA